MPNANVEAWAGPDSLGAAATGSPDSNDRRSKEVKKIVIALGTVVVLAGIAVAVYAAYNIDGSGAGGFTGGTAADLAVSPDSGDLNNILPTETKTMDVTITNNNPVQVQVTGLTLAFNDSGLCGFSYAPLGSYPFNLGASSSTNVQVNVTMGNADPSCEGNAGLIVTATATGTMP